MKVLDVARKEMLQSYRSLTGIMFMFVVPVLVTGLFYFMFGGMGQGESFTLPQTSVVFVNLDEGNLPAGADFGGGLPANLDFDPTTAGAMGDVLRQILLSDDLAELMIVTEAADAAAARASVDNQTANVAVIIPANFTEALTTADQTATIEVYHDPTLTIGPGLVTAVIGQFADNFSGATIGTEVIMTQLATAGVPVDAALMSDVVAAYTAGAFAGGADSPLVTLSAPAGANEDNPLTEIVGQIMGGMMIFFAFFTGAGTLQSILVEEEKGTLARLFTTPTPVSAILGGKVLGTVIMLVVQITTLLLFGHYVFGIDWGAAGPLLLAGAGLVLIAAATGLLLVSLLRSTRQAGAVYGGVLTLTGMIGLISIFTGGQVTPTLQAVTLVVPQGWAVRGLQVAMNGGGVADVLPALAGLLVWVLVFLAISQYRLSRRFA